MEMRTKSTVQRMLLATLVVAMVVGLQSCLEDDFYDIGEVLETDIATIEQYISDNNITAIEDENSGIFIQDHGFGNGWRPWINATVTAHFVGTTLNGTEFVNTYDEDGPRTFDLGSVAGSGSTEGLQYTISLINQGDSVTAFIPSVYAFKNIGFDVVAPNTVVKYTIRLLDINLLDEQYSEFDQYAMDQGFFEDMEVDEFYGTRFVRHVEGNGDQIEQGNLVYLFYDGQLLDGERFDTNFGQLFPFEVTVGEGRVISGFELGLLNLYEGDSATIFIPSNYGYKDQPQEDNLGNEIIPANTPIVFGLKVVDVVENQ